MMADNNFLFLLAYCMLVGFTIVHATAYNRCQNTVCPGPLKFYEDLACKPIKNKIEDCCAVSYDCDIFFKSDPLKCYTKTAVYSIGERLKDHAKLPCEKECICTLTKDNVAQFVCTYHKCHTDDMAKACYPQHWPQECCPSSTLKTCLPKTTPRHICHVNGELYIDEQIFKVDTDPTILCTCKYGYNGTNVAPFCAKMNRNVHSPRFDWPADLRHHCAPIYEYKRDTRTTYPRNRRCQLQGDTVIPNPLKSNMKKYDNINKEKMQCTFGGLSFDIDDELSRPKTGPMKCIQCVCEVPPYLTCRALTSKPSDSISETELC